MHFVVYGLQKSGFNKKKSNQHPVKKHLNLEPEFCDVLTTLITEAAEKGSSMEKNEEICWIFLEENILTTNESS